MSGRPITPALTLGIAPTTRGYGWAAFNSPLNVYDWGLVFVRSDKNLRCVKHFERLLDRLQPELVVMEEPSRQVFRTKRVLELHRLLKSVAHLKQIEVATYRRDQVQSTFAMVGAHSQQEIAESIARHFPDLAHRVPRRRSAWMGEDRRTGLFAAVALVLSHFHIGGSQLVESMKPLG
jgi:Holliday junction resolvasome RuvABC endonuclease subunit